MRFLPSFDWTCVPVKGFCEMIAPKSKWQPWWERANDFYGFDEREEFVRGATSVGFRPNNRMEAMLGQYAAGYVRGSFPSVKSHTGKPDVQPR